MIDVPRCPDCRADRAYDLQHAGRRFRRWAWYAGISSAVCLLAVALMFDQRSYLATIVVVAIAKPIIVIGGLAAGVLSALAYGRQRAGELLLAAKPATASSGAPFRAVERCERHAPRST